MAKRKSQKKAPPRRVSPLKPGLSGARNWATAQVRSAAYSRKHMMRLVGSGILLFFTIVWLALWMGGFLPTIKASGDRFTKDRLMGMGFVVKYVDVVGEGHITESEVRAVLGVYSGDYLFDMDIKNAQTRVQNLGWVDTAIVRRLWPNRIVVHVNERRPYALWQEDGVIQVVDRTGVVIGGSDAGEFTHLPLVVGAGGSEQAEQFLTILAKQENMKANVEAVVYVNQRRWDVVLKGGVRILLPAENPQEALARLEGYNRTHDIFGLDVERIDMRIKGRLMLLPRQAQVMNLRVKRV